MGESMSGLPSFVFAGIEWPARIPEFHRSRYNVRKLRSGREVQARMRFAYYHAPRPILARGDHGRGFYLASDGAPGLRWRWADDVCRSIQHRGWFTDPDGCGDTIRGIVLRLPRSRGFLAGWSMGESMASALSYTIHETEEEAARAADDMAERAAEVEREAEEARRASEEEEDE